MAEPKPLPAKDQVVNHMSTLHFLGATAQAGPDNSIAVKAMPVAYLGHPATRRADRRLPYDVKLYRVKRPDEGHGAWDYYTAAGLVPAAEAFLPMNPACA